MSILTMYDECSKEDIMNMTEKELREAVIRILSLHEYTFGDDDGWFGTFLLPDEVADAFRSRS